MTKIEHDPYRPPRSNTSVEGSSQNRRRTNWVATIGGAWLIGAGLNSFRNPHYDIFMRLIFISCIVLGGVWIYSGNKSK